MLQIIAVLVAIGQRCRSLVTYFHVVLGLILTYVAKARKTLDLLVVEYVPRLFVPCTKYLCISLLERASSMEAVTVTLHSVVVGLCSHSRRRCSQS